MRQMATCSRIGRTATLAFAAMAVVASSFAAARAAPTAEVAKRCLHYAYLMYPYKRPGAVPMSGDRQAYFQDCMGKNGDVPTPEQASTTDPASTKGNKAAATKD
jgi:hypothetical protein